MTNPMIYTLTETVIRKTLNEIQDSPQRSIRNLIDMALHFTKGGFQKHFFTTAQTMLQNENSGYYKLITDCVNNIDYQRVIDFGINMGYNSFIEGAKTIRTIEKQKNYNIPWCLTLTVNGKDYIENEEKYHSIIRQGMELGIYTWIIECTDNPEYIINIAKEFTACAFVFICQPQEISHAMLDEADETNNIMFAVNYAPHISDACRLLRKRKQLYSVLYNYSDDNISEIALDEILQNIENLHPVFTVFISNRKCSDSTRKTVYQYICDARNRQKYSTALWDFYYDNMYVDSIISDDCCSAFAAENGRVYTYMNKLIKTDCNIFDMPLESVFKKMFPKIL